VCPAPTYETDVLGLLSAANTGWNNSASTAADTFVPCPPSVVVVDEVAFPPCFAFVGATGARRYEIFARAVSKIDENGDWFRLMGDAHDAVAERMGRMTFEDTDTVRKLMGFFGTTEQWQVCFQSCSANDTCSGCSDPLTLRFNATGAPSALCRNNTAVIQGPRQEDADNLGALVLSFSPPEAVQVLLLVAVCLVAVSGGMGLVIAHDGTNSQKSAP
jgi:hypothetical protein